MPDQLADAERGAVLDIDRGDGGIGETDDPRHFQHGGRRVADRSVRDVDRVARDIADAIGQLGAAAREDRIERPFAAVCHRAQA